MEDKEGLKLNSERKVWLSGIRFWLILICLLVNISLLALVCFMRTDGCVICLYTTDDKVKEEHKKNVLSKEGEESFQKYRAMSDSELIALLVSDTHVGFGYSEGDIATSLLYERGYDIEPVLKTFNAWPMSLFELSWSQETQEGQKPISFKIFSGLTHPMRSSFQKYLTHKKAPYQLSYVLAQYNQNGDLSFAQEALWHRSSVRLWHGYYQTLGLSQEEAWKALLAMKLEAFEKTPSHDILLPSLFSLFTKDCPPTVSKGLIDQRLQECVALDDEMVLLLLRSLDEYPYAKAKFCFRLLQVPRKGPIHEIARDTLAVVTKDPRLKNISIEKLVAWVQAAKKAIHAPSLPQPQENKRESSLCALVQEKKPIAQTQAPSRHVTYVVKQGDTIWKIAQKFKVDPNKLIAFNSLKKGQISPGQKLQIPEK